MDTGNFISSYENRLKELIRAGDTHNMVEYMLDCAPLVEAYYDKTPKTESFDKVFGTKIVHGTQRKELYRQYLQTVENYKGNDVIDKYNPEKTEDIDNKICLNCGDRNFSLNEHTSQITCHSCGLCEFFLGEGVTFKEEHENFEKIISYTYKRDNHFNEWLLQFQARESTNIPPDVIDRLRSELKKQKIKSLQEITHTKIRGLLRKLRLNKYYEHVPYITNILNGIHPPRMEQALEDKLRKMFKEIQEPFDRNCPKERKNFLSYSYVLYKFCELLSEDDYLNCFPLLKSKEKLHQQDVIWKKICRDLQWEFIPTV